MIYLFFGQDLLQGQQKFQSFINGFIKEKDAAIFRLEEEDFSEAEFEEFLGARTLFEKKCLVIGKRLFASKNISSFILKNLERCAGSENIFAFWEEDLDKDVLKRVKKHAQKVEEFKRKAGKEHNKKEGFNIFSITDAFSSRQKRRAWILFQKALMAGVGEEEVFWRLVWQTKNLLLLKSLNSFSQPAVIKATGWHPYVAKKTIQASSRFSQGELKKYFRELVELYHNARYGLDDFSLGIERLILKL